MIDFYYQLRQRMVETMQVSLKQIRQVLGFGVQEFGDLIGLTRQTINNLETQKNKMSSIQYIAICAVIDNCLKDKPELLPILSTILCSNEDENHGNIFETIENGSLLKKWFLCFPDESKILRFGVDDTGIIDQTDFNNIAENYRVFLDQTALYENGFSEAIQPLSGLLKNNGNKIIIPLRSVEAIQNQMISTNREEITMAQRAMKILMDMQMQDLVEIRGEKSDSNVISTFVSVFAKFKCVNRLALITCDRKLAKQIEALNNDEMGGFHILVLKYENGKGFRKWQEEDFQDKESIEKIYINSENIQEQNKDDELKCWGVIS